MTSFFSGAFAPRPERSGDDENGGGRETPSLPGNPFKNPLAITIIIVALIGAIVVALSGTWTEVLWFQQLGADRVLWTRWLSMGALGLFGFLVMFLVVALVIQWAYKKRPLMMRGESASNLRAYQQAIAPVRRWLFLGLPALIALTTGISFSSNWQQVVMWFNRAPFGEVDPQFGLDISFYVFTLPLLQALMGFLLNVLVVALAAIIIVNYLYGGIGLNPRPNWTNSARKQIGIMAATISLLIALRYWLGIYSMLTKGGEIADGAMYADVNANIPAQMILAVISLLVAILFVVAAFRGTWQLPAAGVAVTVVSALVIGGAYPALIQQFKVTPNARQLEEPYIQRNIDATLNAYGLDDVEYQNYAAKTDVSAGQLREDSESTSQIRLLDPMVLAPTVRQLQQSRPYYTFDKQLSVDRYTIDGEQRDTVIAVRDLNLAGLQEQQQTWVNLHTVYTHGFGVVAAYGNSVKTDGTPTFWEQSIPSKGEMGDYEERVYFSPNVKDYSIVGAPEGTAPQELDYPDDGADSGQVQSTFSGDGGPSVGNIWNKLLYAVKFGSSDIFFSSQTNSESQILYNRNPLERVAKVAPFLTLEQKAYPAVVDMDGDDSTPKRLVWIVDAYTTSNNYPYAQHQSLDSAITDSRTVASANGLQVDEINYMRNSVKAVVDAYDGSVSLFGWDDTDPLLQAWSGVYPGMVKDVSEISGDLMSHFRYPEDMFKVQRSLLTTYHVTEAAEYYTGGDRWRLSEDPSPIASEATTSQQLQAPYYLTMQMPEQESAEFSLTSVFVPAGGGDSKRAAMAGFLAVDSETGNTAGEVREGYGKLRLIALPSSTTVPGPGQVQNNFNSSQLVASELNLLDQQGSKVIRGNLLTLPVGGGLLYVQPVYVQSTSSTAYPVLRYVLTAFGDQVGFAKTLEEALDQTFGGDSQATVATPDGNSGGGTGSGTGSSVTVDPEVQLNEALLAARDAMESSDAALKAGDWTAYGKAQTALTKALDQAILLRSQLDAGKELAGILDSAQSGEATQ